MIIKLLHKLIFLILLVQTFLPDELFAQGNTADDSGSAMYSLIMIIVLIVSAHLVFIPLLLNEKDPEEIKSTAASKKSIFKIIRDKLSGTKPIEEESSILMHDDYDGIRELDNNIPPWFNILFYGTIVFALVYMLDYHVFKTGKLPFQEYADEVYAAEMHRDELIKKGAFINENNVVLLTDAESINSGKQIFSANCIPCHGNNAEGTVGPNLTDQYWIHGGGVKNVFKTVKYGVPVKGMIAWQNQFNPKMMQQVVSYVISLQGKNPGSGKSPEGELFSETDSLKSKTDSVKSKTEKISKDTVKADSSLKK